MSQDDQKDNESLPKRVSPWLQFIMLLAAVGGVIVTIVRFFIPIGQVDLTIWIQQEIPIKLPSELDSVPVLLSYGGEAITHATVLDVNISNSGSVPLGSDDKWQMTLRTNDGSTLVLLGHVETKPANIEVEVIDGSSPDRLVVQVGLFNPDDSLSMRLLVLEPADVSAPIILAETRIANLSTPTVTKLPLRERLQDAFVTPLWVLTLVILVVGILWEQQRSGWPAFKKNPIGGAFRFIWTTVFASAFIAYALAWVLAWAVFLLIEAGLL